MKWSAFLVNEKYHWAQRSYSCRIQTEGTNQFENNFKADLYRELFTIGIVDIANVRYGWKEK